MKKNNMMKRIASLALAMVMLLSCVPSVWAVDDSTDIKAIAKPTGLSIVEDYDDYFGDGWESKLGLPESVTVTLANDTTVEAPVTWDLTALDTREPGYYYLPGQVILPEGATNGQNLTVSITIQVRKKTSVFTDSFEYSGNTGADGIRGAWSSDGILYYGGVPANTGRYAGRLRSHPTAAKTTTTLAYQLPALAKQHAEAVSQMGGGQYYVSMQVRDYLETSLATEVNSENLYVHFQMAYTTENVTSFTMIKDASGSNKSSNKVLLNDQAYQEIGMVVDLTGEETGLRNYVYMTSDTSFVNQFILADDLELVALNVPLKAEPAAVAEIRTQLQSRFVAINYDQYVGEDWKTALLPETVEILTDKGDTTDVAVTWNCSGLDLSKVGKYTLTGTLDDSVYPNPNGFTVQQNIYVRQVDNLLSNGGFEEGWSGWTCGYFLEANGTPAAEGNKAVQVQSPLRNIFAYQVLFLPISQQTILAERVAEAGEGQYYIGAQVRDYLKSGETAHTDPLRVYIQAQYKNDASASSYSSKGSTETVTLSGDNYLTTGGVFDFTGEEKMVNPALFMASDTNFSSQWILVDDMQVLPINILIPFGEEPADIAEVTEEIPVRAVVQNYDQYVGANWKESLGLPATVQVKTSKGLTADVPVIWDYTPLNLEKLGKYVLVGTLDDSLYPNPNNLYVTQIIYIREPKNLITNPSFENGATGWSWGWLYKSHVTPAADGDVAIAVRSSDSARTFMNLMFPSDTLTLGSKVVENGAGQYYLSAQVRDYLHSDETAHTDPLNVNIQLRYKKDASSDASSSKGDTQSVTLTGNYQKTSGIFNLDGDEAWIRMDLYLKSSTKFTGQWIMVDDMQFIALNVTVQTYEGAMEEVQTIIPDRKIIQNYPDYIAGYTTADLMFPETVQVRSTTGEIVEVDVKWNYSGLNLSKLGTYTLVGALDDMKLENPDGLTVSQTVHVVSYQNLLTQGDFEDGTSGWNYSSDVSAMSTAIPKLEGNSSLEVTIGRLDDYRRNDWLQAFYSSNMLTLGPRITQTGAGRYFFGVWLRGSENATDVGFHARFLYQNVAKGDTLNGTGTAQQSLSATEFKQASGIVTVPGDVTWARFDIYYDGTKDEMRLSTLYMDKAEIVPLNVEVPNMNDIIYCEEPANIYVHQGTSVAGLKLPEKLEVLLKNEQRFDLEVEWDTSSFDPNKIGEQTITGKLVLGNKYRNTQNFVPTVKVTIRAKGEDLRQTIYISNSGSEDNDGLSPESPKKEVTNIPTYLEQGYNVKLKRGDIWYLPNSGISLSGIYGTEDVPVVLGAYGSGDELPIIAYLLKIENSEWKLVDAKRNIYAADVSSLGQRNGISVHRCFVNDEAYTHRNRTNYVTLKAGEYCSYNGTLYIRVAEGAPENVEVTPYTGGIRLSITDVSHLTIEYIHFKGSSAIQRMISIDAPTEYLKFQYCNITHCFYYIMMFESDDERIHYKPEISHCYIDAMLSEGEGAVNDGSHWQVHIIEGITMRDGVDGAWIHHNHIRNMSHAAIAIESLSASKDYKTTGVRNCYVEDNLIEGGYALYTRAFNITGERNASGIPMCRDNVYRRNRVYDMTTSSHLFGENNLVYSNIFSYTHCEYDEDGNLFDGKSAQPYGFDVLNTGSWRCVGNIVVNNTFYDVSSAVALYDKNDVVYNNLIANNLIVNWTSDSGAYANSIGAIYDNTVRMTYVMNNGVYAAGQIDHFVVDDKIYVADDVNGTVAGYSGNIFAEPKFLNADLTLSGKEVRQDFTLSSESPFRYAGMSLYNSIYASFPAWERLKAEYTDLNGTVFLAESPSIGAISYSELVTGEVASVAELPDVVARTGAKFSQLFLPETVSAVSESGIDVKLLIVWNETGFDSSKPGTVTITGQLRNGPHTDLNVDGKTVSINVQIRDRLELLNVETRLNKLTVLYNSSLESVIAQLPQTLNVRVETGFEEELPVTWVCENYDPTTPGEYVFKCILPEDMISNTDEWDLEVVVQLLHEIGRGIELLINPDFIDGSSASPWTVGWGTGNFRITQDPQYLKEGEPAAAIVTVERKYASLQQDVRGQVQLLGEGQYLFRCSMRAYDSARPIDSSYACLQIQGATTYNRACRSVSDIGTDWVDYISVMNVTNIADATAIIFHTSTMKSDDDVDPDDPKSYIIAGCSFIYLGNTDEEVEATLDSIGLTWNAIKGENESEKNVMSDLTLPSTTGEASTVVWTSSDESVITNDGKVTMGRQPKTVTLTATITYKNGIETVLKFTVTVPRDPSLPVYSASISGDQTVKPGDEFQVVISVDSKNAKAYNAYRFTLSFTTSKLEYVGISDPSATVELDGGRLVISGIGTERPITDTITVTFRAKKSGVTDVKLVSVEMDLDPNASLDTLPVMTIANKTATINVEKVEQNDTGEAKPEKDNSVVIYIVIGLVAAALFTGGVLVWILIKKKKRSAPIEE